MPIVIDTSSRESGVAPENAAPCPFCGEQPGYLTVADGEGSDSGFKYQAMLSCGNILCQAVGPSVKCRGAYDDWDSDEPLEAALEAWNQRSNYEWS